MVSTFSWLDYSEHERRQMLDVIELFRERTTRDELGLGSVRDAFADLLFPGTSTIQTRAKYFLFIPWIYLRLEQKKTSSSGMATRERILESQLMHAIEQSGDSSGLIGRVAKENVQRLASSVYWQGMFTWGIRTFTGSQDEYHRSLGTFYLRQQTRRASRKEYEGESCDAGRHNWHTGLLAAPEEFPDQATFDLTRHEAAYLREQVLTNCPDSLLAFLLREQVKVEGVGFAWELSEDLNATLRARIDHGRNFSELMLGAQLLYNLLLAEKRTWQDRIVHYRQALEEWAKQIDMRSSALDCWDRQKFWKTVYIANPRVHSRAKSFIDRWIELVTGSSSREIFDSPAARQMVQHRESQLKRGLARLQNDRALELWRGAAGASQLDFRWKAARVIVTDILTGLAGDNDA